VASALILQQKRKEEEEEEEEEEAKLKKKMSESHPQTQSNNERWETKLKIENQVQKTINLKLNYKQNIKDLTRLQNFQLWPVLPKFRFLPSVSRVEP